MRASIMVLVSMAPRAPMHKDAAPAAHNADRLWPGAPARRQEGQRAEWKAQESHGGRGVRLVPDAANAVTAVWAW